MEKVKEIFKELDLVNVYRTYEEESFTKINRLIDTSEGLVNGEVYRTFMAKIYKRTK